jgi:hypothetical protein
MPELHRLDRGTQPLIELRLAALGDPVDLAIGPAVPGLAAELDLLIECERVELSIDLALRDGPKRADRPFESLPECIAAHGLEPKEPEDRCAK